MPAEKLIEDMARAITIARNLNPDTLHYIDVFTGNEPFDHEDAKGVRYTYAWRKALPLARAAFQVCAPAVRERCAEDLRDLVERFPEINPSNYDHDDACALNDWGCEVCDAVRALPLDGLTGGKGESELLDDGSCVRCGCVPRNASGLCATCVDEDAVRAGELAPSAPAPVQAGMVMVPRETLQPFVDLANSWHEDESDETRLEYEDSCVTLGQCRDVRAALAAASAKGKSDV